MMPYGRNAHITDEEHYSWEVSMALDLLGFKPEMIKWRQHIYKKQARFISEFLSVVPNKCPPRFQLYLTGSKQEGSSVWDSSDIDLMTIFNTCFCVKNINDIEDKSRKFIFQIDDKNTHPGYLYLKAASFTHFNRRLGYDMIAKECLNGSECMSSQRLNMAFYSALKHCEDTIKSSATREALAEMEPYLKPIDDPMCPKVVGCLKGLTWHDVDIVPAYICVYPELTRRWTVRERKYGWPTKSLIDKIAKHDVHIVPKGCKGSKDRDFQFRICFTFGEIELMKSLNETQMKLYASLKLLFKSTVENHYPGIITSYILKNVLFWICETTPKDTFTIGHLHQLLIESLEFIRHCIAIGNLQNYFIPERNLLEGKLDENNRNGLITLLTSFKSDGILVMSRVTVISANLRVIRSDIILALALCFLRNIGEIRLVNGRLRTTKTYGAVALLCGMVIGHLYLEKRYLKKQSHLISRL